MAGIFFGGSSLLISWTLVLGMTERFSRMASSIALSTSGRMTRHLGKGLIRDRYCKTFAIRGELSGFVFEKEMCLTSFSGFGFFTSYLYQTLSFGDSKYSMYGLSRPFGASFEQSWMYSPATALVEPSTYSKVMSNIFALPFSAPAQK